jgi:hypothetical protein
MSTHDYDRPTGRPVNVTYLVVGLVFLGIVGVWALVSSHVVGTDQLNWLLPLTLVVAGAIGLVAIAARSLTRNRGGAVRLDDRHAGGGDDSEVHDLEARAYAPYPRDTERTRVLDEGDTTTSSSTTDSEGEAR